VTVLGLLSVSLVGAAPGRGGLRPLVSDSLWGTDPVAGLAKDEGRSRVPGAYAAPGVAPRIVGGSPATPLDFPWQVAYQVNGADVCGGTLIAADWLLTAAHCIASATTVQVVVGAKSLTTTDENMQMRVVSDQKEFHPHPEWDPETFQNDIGLIHLETPFVLTDAVSPVALPRRSATRLQQNDILTVTGYGADDTGGTDVDLRWSLNEVALPVMSQQDCQKTYGVDMVTEGAMCVLTEGGRSACDGDSGGPMTWQEEGRAVVRGVSSYVAKEGCLSGKPAGAMRVLHYLDWIQQTSGLPLED